MDHLDKFTSERISGRFYQYIGLSLLGLVNIINGGMMTLISILLTSIQKDFGLTDFQTSVLPAIYQIGVVTGSTVGGDLSKNIGRATSIKFFYSVQIVAGGLVYFCTDYSVALVLFIIYGFFNGFCLNVLSTYGAEIAPYDTRGRWMVALNALLSFGKIFGTLLTLWFLVETDLGSWRATIIYLTLVGVAVMPFVTIFLKESLRYLFANKHYAGFRAVANQIIDLNNTFAGHGAKAAHITTEDVEFLEHEASIHNEEEEKGSYAMLFSARYLKINILVWTTWVGMFLVMVGQSIMMSFWFGTASHGLSGMVFTMIGELPAIALSMLLIDKAHVGRRKMLQAFAISLTFFCYITLVFEEGDMITVLFALTRFAVKGTFLILIPFTAEIYPTKLRSLGLGVGAALGAFGAFVMPFVIIPLFHWKKYSIFVFFGTASLLALVCCIIMPFDTTGQSLEKDYSKAVNEDLLAKDLAD